jgi:predicted aldo/keto reductase-like oxidoreductase
VCPKKIPIGSVMTLIRYRQKHSLLPESEAQWKKLTEKAKTCDECGLCEEKCPYNLSIIPVIQEASVT